jgi:hypothetical protein
MAKKPRYRTKNWKEYNQALVQRGSLTLWVSDDALRGWLHQGKRRRGRPLLFSDAAICCTLTIRAVFRLPLRQTEGFLGSIFRLMAVDLPVPDFSTLSLRGKMLCVPLVRRGSGPLHLLLDSTGLKIRGEGEWRRHRYPKGRSGHCRWRRFHIGVDAVSGEILCHELTLSRIQDATPGMRFIAGASDALASVTADGAYDKTKIYDICDRRTVRPIIPPQKNAKIRRREWTWDPRTKRYARYIFYLGARNAAIRAIRRRGRRRWKQESGYHRRSLVETAFSRTQRIFGQGLRSKRIARQRTEAAIRCHALNVMTRLGMPRTVRA